jgi:hypothetical protein
MDCHTVVIDEGIVEEKLGGGHICYTKVERGCHLIFFGHSK